MPRARDPNRDKAFEIWKEHKGEIPNREISSILDVDEKKIAVWKQRDKWNVVQQTKNSVVQQKKKTNTKQQVQENRSGNPNPASKFTNRNSLQTKHGLFSKFLHEEQIEIIRVMEGLNLADQIWLQIELKFSAIIRMQKIMWVEDANDHLKEESGSSQGMDVDSVSYKVIYAHERFESYVRAQARAMAEYRNLVKQYIELTDEFDERRLKIEHMQLNIDKTKAEIEKLDKPAEGPLEIIIKRKGED